MESLIPPLLAIILAITTRNVVISLFIGIFSGHLFLNNFNFVLAFIALFEGIIALFKDAWFTKTIFFVLLIGSILRLIVNSGGVNGFVEYLTHKKNIIQSKRGALLLAYIIGIIIFIESSITSLIAGAVARPLTDKYGASREKLAYVCDSTSAPICSLIPLNAWGALLIGLITSQINAGVINGNAIEIFIWSIAFNFYAIITLLFVLFIIITDKDFATMKTAEKKAKPQHSCFSKSKGNLWYMVLPILVLIIMMPISLYFSGDGNMLEGSGSTSVFFAVVTSLFFSYFYYIFNNVMDNKTWFENFYAGINDMIPIGIILILALSIGNITQLLETGPYLASIATGNINPTFIPAIIFILSGIIAFSTGTSWGTFSIMIPIAVAFFDASHLSLTIAAVVSGGVFGDHCSPISDTTIISSMASKCNHIDHVNTQLPYALVGGVISMILFLCAGFILN
ncbi:Na+/H+ antiporter NhaC family protein [Thiotrichales bacterium HSG1]|nr:Na+/H+ antiporter NhaC family protein [Thiotrichales bacterium HSG1]